MILLTLTKPSCFGVSLLGQIQQLQQLLRPTSQTHAKLLSLGLNTNQNRLCWGIFYYSYEMRTPPPKKKKKGIGECLGRQIVHELAL